MLRHTALAVALAGGITLPAQAQRPSPLTEGVLRVCADPDNMPFSNQAGDGFENKIAEFLAQTWNSKLEYVWWPVRRGFFSRGLNGRYCDVAITAPAGLDMAGVTEPYFRSSYVIVYRKDSGLDISSLDDPKLKQLKIGVNLLNADAENTPPAMALSSHGVVGTLVGFGTFYSEGGLRPEDIINAVVDSTIDVAIVWGPVAGYFAKTARVPLVLRALPDDSLSGIPFSFSLGLATRRRETVMRDSLQKFVDAKRPELQKILEQFN
ncbi:MAG TPA: quinoprotein dehydrogenase-associated putative ABC transporter substrate-binding protein, partial [Mycobacterium sp.]